VHPHYSIQAVLVYVAVGIALGLVGWAVLLHDGSTGSTPSAQAPAQTTSHTGKGNR
jgi:hypothetical protein